MERQKLLFGFYSLTVLFNGKVEIHHVKGKSFIGNADISGVQFSVCDSLDTAVEQVRKWGVYVWNNNDRASLVKEYSLTREFVEQFLRYSWDKSWETEKVVNPEARRLSLNDEGGFTKADLILNSVMAGIAGYSLMALIGGLL